MDSPIVAIDDPCTLGICVPDAESMKDADLQPHAVALLGFFADQISSVSDLVRVDSGWAFALRTAEGDWSVLVVNEVTQEGRQYVLPDGTRAGRNDMWFEEGTLYISASTPGNSTGVTLHGWDLSTDAVSLWNLPDLPAPAQPRGVWDDDVLLVADRGLLSGDTAVWVLDADAGELIQIGAEGRVMNAAMSQGILYLIISNDGNWTVEMQDVSGTFRHTIWHDESPLSGIWGRNGFVAFGEVKDTSDVAGARLWEVDTMTHELTRLGQGWEVHFTRDTIHYLTKTEGTSSPFVSEWSRSLDEGSAGVFMTDVPLWDTGSGGLWWLEAPRADHRFPETPNPTPYVTVLMTSDR